MNSKPKRVDIASMSYWQRIFAQSKVNDAQYHGEELPHRPWDWPKDTYLSRRLGRGPLSVKPSASS